MIASEHLYICQQVMRKKLFPGTQYDKLENKAVYDILSFPRWDHPALPPLSEAELAAHATPSSPMRSEAS